VGEENLPVTIPLDIGITEGLECGRDSGSGVTTEYNTPFNFTGTIHDVVVDLSGGLIVDADARMRAVMAHQ
jgi:arylsulfatase